MNKDNNIYYIDRRFNRDRRSKRTNPFHPYYTLLGRRQRLRRLENEPYFLDQYSEKLFIGIMFIIGLSLVDAFFTIYLINRGVIVELNPIMDSVIAIGPQHFVIIKLTLTFLGVLLLIFCKQHPMITMILSGVVFLYILIALYHIFILLSHDRHLIYY
ncbi:MAG: hypothetical protein HY999_06860 [Nitrospinae bacterium]|nr:hypothetical protein [Nitrospinota bacterium]